MLRQTLSTVLLIPLLALPITSSALTLTWVGCGITKKAFMQELAVAYKKKRGVDINLEGGGATKGIRSTMEHLSDMGGSCRYRVEGEAPDSKIKFNPLAWDALVVAVHKDNPVESITLDDIQRLYRGEITNWKQLGGRDQPLDLLVRKGKISGVGLTLRQLVFNDADAEFVSDNIFNSSGPLEEAIENNPNAVGVTGISSARKRDFKILKLDGKAPDYDNIKAGNYLLYRPLYLITDKSSPNIREMNKFLEFAHSKDGRNIMRQNGVVPYLEALSLTMKQREQWQKSRKGRAVIR